MSKPPQYNQIHYYTTDDEMESKFAECGMEAILCNCGTAATNTDPDVLLLAPNSSVVHKREHGLKHINQSGVEIALIFYWEDAGGTPRRSIRWFVYAGIKHRLRLRAAN